MAMRTAATATLLVAAVLAVAAVTVQAVRAVVVSSGKVAVALPPVVVAVIPLRAAANPRLLEAPFNFRLPCLHLLADDISGSVLLRF